MTDIEQGGLSNPTLDEEPELTELEVEELLEKVRTFKLLILNAEKRRDGFHNYYRQKMAKADEICETDTRYYRSELATVEEKLRRFAEANITGKKRSIKFPSGTLSFTKQQPQFFIDGLAVTNDNPKLIELARSLDTNLVASKETARWCEFKKRLVVDDEGNVLIKETGEVIPDLRARTVPDKFDVTPA